MNRAAMFVLTLALFLYDHAGSNRVSDGDDELSLTGDHLERLAEGFDELVDEKVDEACDEFVNTSRGWIEALDKESVKEVAADCNRVTGRCGRGCGTGRGQCVGGKLGSCQCDEGECSVDEDGKKYKQCARFDVVVEGLKSGRIDRDDLEPENAIARAVDAVAGLPDAIKANVPAKALGYVVRVAQSPNFRKEVKRVAVAGVDQICMATKMQWLSKGDKQIAAFGSELMNKLHQALIPAATMLKDALMFIFAPAGLIPGVGETLKTMFEAIARWGATLIQKKFEKWIVRFVGSLLQYLGGQAIGVEEAMIKVFRCDIDPFDFENWAKSKIDNLLNPPKAKAKATPAVK